jgi:hypothetical protein
MATEAIQAVIDVASDSLVLAVRFALAVLVAVQARENREVR